MEDDPERPDAQTDQRILREARVLVGVGHDERIVGRQRMRAKRLVPRRLRHRKSHLRLGPLLILIDQRDEGDRYVADQLRELHDVIERALRWRIEDVLCARACEPRGFVLGELCRHAGFMVPGSVAREERTQRGGSVRHRVSARERLPIVGSPRPGVADLDRSACPRPPARSSRRRPRRAARARCRPRRLRARHRRRVDLRLRRRSRRPR